jgi:hypothetical protein
LRHPTALLVLIGALALQSAMFAGAARARDITLPKTTPEALRAACDKAGGKFSQGARGYGCGTDCAGGPGTDCTVYCPTGEKCTAQVIGARRPHSVAEALTKPARR